MSVATVPDHLTRKLGGRASLLLGELIAAAQSTRVPNAVEQAAFRRRIEALPAREQRRMQHAFQQWQDGVGAGDVTRLAPMHPSHVPPEAHLDAEVYVAAIAPQARAQALEDLAAGDIESFLTAELDDPAANDALALVVRNAGPLIARQLFERALVFAFRSGYTDWPGSTVAWLFSVCDPGRLRAQGDPIPDGDHYVVYRGGGRGACLSWSRDPKVAAYYASLSGTAVIRKAALEAADVRVYFATAANGVRLPWLTVLSDEFIAVADPGGEPLDQAEVDDLMQEIAR